ncbi:MAG: hypothetical protein RR557_06745 [Bacilli bacterium]
MKHEIEILSLDDEKKEKKPISFIIFVLIISIISGTCSGILFYRLELADNKNNILPEDPKIIVEKSKKEIAKENNIKYSQIKFKEKTFSIPNTFIYQIKDNKLKLSPISGGYTVFIDYEPGDIEILKEQKGELLSHFKKSGFEVYENRNTTIDDILWVTHELKTTEEYFLVAYAQIDENNIITAILGTSDNSINYEPLTQLSLIVKKAK